MFEFINNRFKQINLHYNFDYDFIEITNYDTFKKYLENLYLYKNYILIIINLYEFFLKIKDNFNLVYTTIDKIKNLLIIFKKVNIDNYLNNFLIDKLNIINDKYLKDLKYRTFEDMNEYLDSYLK